MTGWVRQSTATEPGEYVVDVGGVKRLATWNARDGRWFDGYMRIDPAFVRGYFLIPEPDGGYDDDR